MLERLRDCLIFFIVSDLLFGFFIFLAFMPRYAARVWSAKFAWELYIVVTIVMFFSSVYLAFFGDFFSPHCQKVYRNKFLYTIDIGKSKTIEELTERKARVRVFYMVDGETDKRDTSKVYFLLKIENEDPERIELAMTKKENIYIESKIFDLRYIMTSDIIISREAEHSFSVSLIYRGAD